MFYEKRLEAFQPSYHLRSFATKSPRTNLQSTPNGRLVQPMYPLSSGLSRIIATSDTEGQSGLTRITAKSDTEGRDGIVNCGCSVLGQISSSHLLHSSG